MIDMLKWFGANKLSSDLVMTESMTDDYNLRCTWGDKDVQRSIRNCFQT